MGWGLVGRKRPGGISDEQLDRQGIQDATGRGGSVGRQGQGQKLHKSGDCELTYTQRVNIHTANSRYVLEDTHD